MAGYLVAEIARKKEIRLYIHKDEYDLQPVHVKNISLCIVTKELMA